MTVEQSIAEHKSELNKHLANVARYVQSDEIIFAEAELADAMIAARSIRLLQSSEDLTGAKGWQRLGPEKYVQLSGRGKRAAL